MNILMIALAFAPYSGVGSARMTSLADFLIKKGENVTVISYDSRIYGENEQHRKVPEGIKLVCCDKLSDKKKNINNLKDFVLSSAKNGNFDLCISSVGPYESMFFIQEVCEKNRIPYIIDYRDPWLYEKNTEKIPVKLRFKQTVYNFLCTPKEKLVTKYAAHIVLVTEQCRQDLIKRYNLPESKCSVIFNGYEKLPQIQNVKTGKDFAIAIAGKFSYYNQKAANEFMAACRNFCKVERTRLVHIGLADKDLQTAYPDVYVNAGIKSYKETMTELKGADALLISYAHTAGLGTKVFDYIALNKPIIYMGVFPSELAQLVSEFENGFVCRNEEEAYNAMLKIRTEQIASLTKKDISVYSREVQNEKYYKLISAVSL